MNITKARDFYSEYYEGTLDGGLKQAFESALQSDPHIQSEYQEFVATMQRLAELPEQTIEIPFDLHDRISARLDRHVYETTRQTQPSGRFQWRYAFLGAVAATAIFAAVIALRPGDGQGPGQASLIGGPSRETRPQISVVDGQAQLSYRIQSKVVVTVRDEATGVVLQEFNSANAELAVKITNSRPDPVVVKVEFSNGLEPIRLALPGTTGTEIREGTGPLEAVALAIAQTFRVPVIIEADSAKGDVTWKFDAADTAMTISSRLAESDVRLETRSTGVMALSR